MTFGPVQGRRRGKRKAMATIVMDDPEHILIDRKVNCSTLAMPIDSAAVLLCC